MTTTPNPPLLPVSEAAREAGFPFKPNDWAVDGTERVARVLRVHNFERQMLFDLVIYSRDGRQIGRQSPACGGPRTYEPMCSMEGWERIAEPHWPLTIKWRPDGTLGYWAGTRLPPANYVPRKRRRKTHPAVKPYAGPPSFTLEELDHMVQLFNGANDPLSASIGSKALHRANWTREITRPFKAQGVRR